MPETAPETAPAAPGTRPLRVLTVIDHVSDYGGAERFAAALALHYPRDRVEPWICSTRASSGRVAEEIAAAGIPLTVLGRRAKWDVHRLGGLVSLMRRERFDVVHSHKFGSNMWATMAAASCRVPVIVAHEHTWSYSGNPLRMWLDGRVIGRLATRFVAVSPLDAERMVTLEHVPEEKVLFIPTAYIPRPPAASAGAGIRAELRLPDGAPLVGVAAVLRPQKALDVLVRAHARVLGELPDAHLLIAGEGECRGELEALARELGIERSVHLLGAREDAEEIIRALDVAALSSDFEGLPLFALECLANGTPLVSTDVGAMREVIDDGEDGLIVPPRDPEALGGAIVSLLADGGRRELFAERARLAARRFTIEAVAERFADLYEELTASRGR